MHVSKLFNLCSGKKHLGSGAENWQSTLTAIDVIVEGGGHKICSN